MFGGLMNNLTSPFRSSPASTPTAAFATNSAPASPRNLSTEMSIVPPASPPSHGSATAAAGNGPSNRAAGTSANDTAAQGIGTFPNDGSSVNDLTLSSPSLYVDSLKFFQLIQDAGTAYTSTRKPTKHWKPDKSPHKISYPKIYECGDTLFKNVSAASSLFPKIHKANPTRTRQNIMNMIFQMRTSYKKEEINPIAFPGIADHMANLDEVPDQVFILDQKDLMIRIKSAYGENRMDDLIKPTANDRIRLFGILLSEDFLDDLRCLVDRRKRNRHELDSTEFSSDAVYARVQIAFNNEDVEVSSPCEWNVALEKYPDWVDLDPNDEKRIDVQRTGAHMKWIYMNTMTAFNVMMKKFKSETGGGAGHATDVATWQDRPSHEIIDYNQESAFLTWVFMKDKDKHHPLSPATETIPYGREAGTPSANFTSPKGVNRNLLNTDKLVSVMEKGASALASAIETMGGAPTDGAALADRSSAIFDAIDKAEMRKEKIEMLEEGHSMRHTMLSSVESAIKQLYAELGNIGNNTI